MKLARVTDTKWKWKHHNRVSCPKVAKYIRPSRTCTIIKNVVFEWCCNKSCQCPLVIFIVVAYCWCVGAPYPIKIVSDAQGLMPNEYTVQWERPMTGGLPIEKYEIKYRKVCIKKTLILLRYVACLKLNKIRKRLFSSTNDLKKQEDTDFDIYIDRCYLWLFINHCVHCTTVWCRC